MVMRYFVDFDTAPSGDTDERRFLMARLFRGIHLAIVQECGPAASNQTLIGVAFPRCDDRYSGDLLRVFSGESAVLERLLRQQTVHRYAQALGAVVREVLAGHSLACFVRTRIHDRLSPSALRRAQRRLAEKGFAIPSAPKDRRGFPIFIQSDTTGQEFPVYVRRDTTSEILDRQTAARFNSYGLSSDAPVPVF